MYSKTSFPISEKSSTLVKAGSDVTTEVAKNCLKRIRTLRHPNIVTYVEGLESEKFVYIATEYVTPLSTYLDKIEDIEESSMAISWGLHQVVNGLSFLINQVNLIHNNVCLSSIFIDRAGEWKLFGLEYMFSGEDGYPPSKGPRFTIFLKLKTIFYFESCERSGKNVFHHRSTFRSLSQFSKKNKKS